MAPLAITLASTIWIGFTKHRLAVNRTGMEFAFAFGGFFFLLALITAVGDDVRRNWGVQTRTMAWNPLLMWKVLLYLCSAFFCAAAFLAYHQGAWLTVEFIVFSIGSAITAQRCFKS